MTRVRFMIVSLGLAPGLARAVDIELRVTAGSPLQIRIDGKTPIRQGQPVRGTLLHPVYVFDREVWAAGSLVEGSVSCVTPAPLLERLQGYLNGRLRTRREALVDFHTLTAPDGRSWNLDTEAARGVPALIRLSAGVPPSGKRRVIQEAKDRLANHEGVRAARTMKAEAHAGGLPGLVRGASQAIRAELISYWPFGVQTLGSGTSFTAVLREPVNLGVRRAERPVEIEGPRSTPAPDSVVRARLLDTVDSRTAQAGSPVRAVTTRPLFSPEGQLILPEGTVILGEVRRAVPARRFGRNGRLQIRFTKIQGRPGSTDLLVGGNIAAVEAGGRAGMLLDDEGGARIPFSKRRVFAPAIAIALATAAVPDEESRIATQGAAPGWSGFGLAGAAVSLGTRAAAGPLGWFGSASSVYFNLIRKADELVFPVNTVLEIRFGRATIPVAQVSPASREESLPPPPSPAVIRSLLTR